MGVREDRLRADYEAIRRFRSHVVRYQVISRTDPPEVYRIYYDLKSLVSLQGGVPHFKRGHEVKIEYPPDYPRARPSVRVISSPPPLHPNIWKDGRVCIEDRWIPGIGIPLDGICELVGKIIAYQEYNLGSPANGDRQLVEWIEAHRDQLPLDSVQIRLPDVSDAVQWGDEEYLLPPSARITFG